MQVSGGHRTNLPTRPQPGLVARVAGAGVERGDSGQRGDVRGVRPLVDVDVTRAVTDATVGGGVVGQPAGFTPLQVALCRSSRPYRRRSCRRRPCGSRCRRTPRSETDPTGTVVGVRSQPELSRPLQVRPSITETVLSLMLVTYTVWVARSTVSVLGSLPTVTVGQGPAQPRTVRALQRRPSITDTVFPARNGTIGVVPVPDVDRGGARIDGDRGRPDSGRGGPTSADPKSLSADRRPPESRPADSELRAMPWPGATAARFCPTVSLARRRRSRRCRAAEAIGPITDAISSTARTT